MLAAVFLAQESAPPKRIISLIPGVTEMLFAIGAGPQVVGVSTFDRFPEAAKLPTVGALIDPDTERILALRPDLVIVYGSQSDLRAQLSRAEIPTYIYSHAGLADVTKTLRDIGTRVGRRDEAYRLADEIERRIAAVRKRIAGRPRPRTLIVFSREPLALRGIYASGGVGFIRDIVDAAGGVNVFDDVKREAVQATTEQILARRPDVILELRAEGFADGMRERESAVWKTLRAVPAVRNGRVHILVDRRVVVPGPRLAEAVELVADTLHPSR